jgi:hypothetical protein
VKFEGHMNSADEAKRFSFWNMDGKDLQGIGEEFGSFRTFVFCPSFPVSLSVSFPN